MTTDSAILQSRLTSVDHLVDGDVAGAPGVARFEFWASEDFSGSIDPSGVELNVVKKQAAPAVRPSRTR